MDVSQIQVIRGPLPLPPINPKPIFAILTGEQLMYYAADFHFVWDDVNSLVYAVPKIDKLKKDNYNPMDYKWHDKTDNKYLIAAIDYGSIIQLRYYVDKATWNTLLTT